MKQFLLKLVRELLSKVFRECSRDEINRLYQKHIYSKRLIPNLKNPRIKKTGNGYRLVDPGHFDKYGYWINYKEFLLKT